MINCFITPHPADYARLHRSLLKDCYPSYLVHYGFLREGRAQFSLQGEGVTDLVTLRSAFEQAWNQAREVETLRLETLLGRALKTERIYRAGPFLVERFTTELEDGFGNYCGECICRQTGELEYLKMYNLSRAESQRLRLLEALFKNDWNFEKTASYLQLRSSEDIARMMVKADLGYFLNPGYWGHLMSPHDKPW